MESETQSGLEGTAETPLRVRWRWVAVTWVAIALLFIAQNVVGALAAGVPVDPQWAVLHEVLYWSLWAAATPLLIAWARRHPLGREAGGAPWLAHIALAAVVAPTQTLLTYVLHLAALLAMGSVPPAGAADWLLERRAAFLVISLTGLWNYAVIVGIYHAFDYRHRFRRQERLGDRLAVRAAELETRLARARLEALRMQLHPHFLFNTLNSISVLAGDEPERAKRMLLRLSDLLRTVLETEETEISLARELDLVGKYLDIQAVRYEERLEVEMEVEEEARSAAVPAFLLQPLVENAVRHGVERSPGVTRVHLTVRRRHGRLRVEVVNPVPSGAAGQRPGAGDARNGAGGRGIGLRNTRERLHRAYGGDHRFEVGTTDGVHRVQLDIPFRSFDRV